MFTLRSLPIAFRALFSSFLILIGVGYLMALSFMYLVVIEPHEQMGQGLVAGISDQYHGLPKGKTLIESALMGPMADKISVADRTRVLTWVHDGAKAEGYPQVKPIFASNCISCHMEGAQSIPPLASFEAVEKVAKADYGNEHHRFGQSVSHSPVRHKHHIPADWSNFRPEHSSGLDSRISRCDSLPDYSDGYRLLVVHQIS